MSFVTCISLSANLSWFRNGGMFIVTPASIKLWVKKPVCQNHVSRCEDLLKPWLLDNGFVWLRSWIQITEVCYHHIRCNSQE
jgi:hypothetical protein